MQKTFDGQNSDKEMVKQILLKNKQNSKKKHVKDSKISLRKKKGEKTYI